jgi:hypothetical protein
MVDLNGQPQGRQPRETARLDRAEQWDLKRRVATDDFGRDNDCFFRLDGQAEPLPCP